MTALLVAREPHPMPLKQRVVIQQPGRIGQVLAEAVLEAPSLADAGWSHGSVALDRREVGSGVCRLVVTGHEAPGASFGMTQARRRARIGSDATVLGAGAAVEAGTVCCGTAVRVEQAPVIGNPTREAQIKALQALPMT
jgi:hypothetical protein